MKHHPARTVSSLLLPLLPFISNRLKFHRFADTVGPVSPIEQIYRKLAKEVDRLQFDDPVAYVYNPLVYAKAPCFEYLSRYAHAPVKYLMMGMNPGPFGMAQTGVPFGEINAVRDWLGIIGPVRKPEFEHPKRPVDGFSCKRSEVSGARLWGWAKSRFHCASRFFEDYYVHNYCPLLFLDAEGRNLTPDKLKKDQTRSLFEACDQALVGTARVLEAECIIAVGNFAEKQAIRSFATEEMRILKIPHPSPASPSANRGWAESVDRALGDCGIRFPS